MRAGPEPLEPGAIERETEAMRAVAIVLEPLSPDERRRVLDWARRFTAPVTRGTKT